ncbi:hypothetical protein ACJJTC_016224 [Scirpophaga incertulas]
MKAWLTEKNIQYDETMKKIEFYDLILKNKETFKRFAIDDLIRTKVKQIIQDNVSAYKHSEAGNTSYRLANVSRYHTNVNGVLDVSGIKDRVARSASAPRPLSREHVHEFWREMTSSRRSYRLDSNEILDALVADDDSDIEEAPDIDIQDLIQDLQEVVSVQDRQDVDADMSDDLSGPEHGRGRSHTPRRNTRSRRDRGRSAARPATRGRGGTCTSAAALRALLVSRGFAHARGIGPHA